MVLDEFERLRKQLFEIELKITETNMTNRDGNHIEELQKLKELKKEVKRKIALHYLEERNIEENEKYQRR